MLILSLLLAAAAPAGAAPVDAAPAEAAPVKVIPGNFDLAKAVAAPKAGAKRPASGVRAVGTGAKARRSKPRLYGGAVVNNARRSGGARGAAQVGVKVPF